jgi:hypothetical protein
MAQSIMQPPDARDGFMLALEDQLGRVIDQVNALEITTKKQQQTIDEIKSENKNIWKFINMMDYQACLITFKAAKINFEHIIAKDNILDILNPIHDEIKSMAMFVYLGSDLIVLIVIIKNKESFVTVINAIESLDLREPQFKLLNEYQLGRSVTNHKIHSTSKWIMDWDNEKKTYNINSDIDIDTWIAENRIID